MLNISKDEAQLRVDQIQAFERELLHVEDESKLLMILLHYETTIFQKR